MIRYFAAHPTAANLLMAGLLIIGLVSTPNVKRETFPEIPADEVEIRTLYPGATAGEVEEAVCQRLEDAIDGIEGLKEMRCEAREGIAIAVAQMREGNDIVRFADDIKTDVDAIDDFPDDVDRPVVSQLGRTDFVASVAVAGPMAPPDLKAYAEQLKDRLSTIPGISKITIGGFSDHQIRIEVPARTLMQFGLSAEQLADIIERQSLSLPAGALDTHDDSLLIRFDDERRRVQEFEDLVVVSAASGAEIRLGDIATITDRFQDDEVKNLFNGQRAAYLVIEKGRGDDTLDVVDAVRGILDVERDRAPPGVTLDITQDIATIVRDRLQMLLRNGAQGLVLVFLTMWVFFNLRFSFWVAAGLPVSFLGTIAIMALFGYSFDMITMVGLLIAVGLMMDDAIVIAENIAAHRRRGAPALQAAVEGTRQVLPGVLSSFLTTVCVFGALAFMQGHIGAVLRVMPVVLIATLAISLLEAFFILPRHLHHAVEAYGDGHVEGGLRHRIEQRIEWVREVIVGRAVDWSVQRRYLTVGTAICLLLATIAVVAGGGVKFRAFPDIESDVVEARVLLPQGTPLQRTEAVVARIVAALNEINADFTAEQPGSPPLVRNIGIQYSRNDDAYESGPHLATVSVDLLSSDLRTIDVNTLINLWRDRTGAVPDVIALNFTEREMGPAGRAIDIRLLGSDRHQLKAASLELQSWLASYDGVLDLSDDLRPGKPELHLRLREGASALGLDAARIAGQLRAAFQGRTASEIQVGPESYEIDVRLSAADRDSLADLEYFTVTTAEGKQVPLNTVAYLKPGRGFARLNRINGVPTVTIQGRVDTDVANVSQIIKHTQKNFLPDLLARYPDIRTGLEGQAKEAQTTGGSLLRNAAVGLIGVFLLLSLQFRSYAEPIVVMTAIPMAFIGVVIGHLIQGIDLSMPSMVGYASLAGVVVNDSILLVTFIKIRRAKGTDIATAARGAARGRFRAILLTSLTTIAGLLPLLLETSLQAQVVAPLVTSIAFGMMTSTVLVLLVAPAFYAILGDLGWVADVKTDAEGHAREAG